MMLQKQTIYDREQLHDYFTIEEQHGVNVRINTPAFLQFCDMLSGALDIAVGSHIQSKWPFQPDWFSQSRIDREAFLTAVSNNARTVYPAFAENNAQAIGLLLDERKTFCESEVRLLWLFMLLHIQAMSDITGDGIQYMAAELDRCKASPIISISRRDQSVSIPSGGAWRGGVTRKTISCSALRLSVSLEDTTQSRTLYLHETLTLFESDGKCLFFLPRSMDPQDAQAYGDYCCAMQDAHRSAPRDMHAQIAKPILDHQLRPAGYLLRDGRVALADSTLEGRALDAAADDSFIYLATEHGIDVISRKNPSWVPFITLEDAVEEVFVDPLRGTILYRCSSCSIPFTAKMQTKED